MGLGRPLVIAAAAALLVACHDARRENPFDPALTPPVALAVAVDEEAGTATLTWTAYAGDEPLHEYQVRRQVQGLTRIDTLAAIADPAATSFTDTTMAPNTPYAYAVVVINTAGLASASEQVVTPGFGAGPVRMLWARPDPRAGAVEVGWSRYRQAAFAAYEVWRRTGESRNDSLVATLSSVEDTTFADLTARADPALLHVYRVVLRAAQEVFGSNEMEARLRLPPVTGLRVRLDSRTATAALSWRAYEGPRLRFAEYRLWCRTQVLAPEVVATLASVGDTAFTDSGLVGATTYAWRVEALTDAGETATSEETSGQIHRLLSEWSTDLGPDQVVRLYEEPEGVTALVAGPGKAEARRYDAQGGLLWQAVLLVDPGGTLIPRSAALGRRQDGTRLLAYAFSRGDPQVRLAAFDAEGAPVYGPPVVVALEGGEPPGPYGEVTIAGVTRVALTRVVVLGDGSPVLEDRFDGSASPWDRFDGLSVEDGMAVATGRWALARAEPSWRVTGVIVEMHDVPPPDFTFTNVNLGAPGGGSVRASQVSQSLSVFHRNQSASSLLPDRAGLPIRLTLDISRGRVEAALWYTLVSSVPLARAPGRVALAFVEGRPGQESAALVADDEAFAVADTALAMGTQPRAIDEVRVWHTADGRQWIGVCQAEANRVDFARASVTVIGRVSLPGPFSSTRRLSQAVGPAAGEMILPLSLAGGGDGRVYVLDAGNGRIQVFDQEGEYITQWGRAGTGAGEFDFGRGLEAQDFRGSVAVDGQGSIYVADSGGRIQRFEP